MARTSNNIRVKKLNPSNKKLPPRSYIPCPRMLFTPLPPSRSLWLITITQSTERNAKRPSQTQCTKSNRSGPSQAQPKPPQTSHHHKNPYPKTTPMVKTPNDHTTPKQTVPESKCFHTQAAGGAHETRRRVPCQSKMKNANQEQQG